MIGRTISHFQILEKLGEGGMGEVWKARDTRLDRTVALKISKDQFSERFEREARAVAALNHPNICTLHDVGPNYLVMELVEGETLAERIKQGPIPLEVALAIAGQVTQALEAAHNQGIVHRDLKPGNIKITPNGAVKVLDFGLAKMTESAPPPASDPDRSPTITLETATRVGTILGTAAYMAPEQAKGRAVDKRADIWAFGVILYEMLTGSQLFDGETVSETLASVLKEEPNLDKIPLRARQLLQVCLRKDPNQRLHDIADARLHLEETPSPARTKRAWLPWAVAAAWAAAAAAFAILWLRAPASEIRSTQFLVAAPGDTQFTNVYGATAVSPDGRYLVFGASAQGNASPPLWLRPLDSLSARPLQGTEGGNFPFWSPDSRSIAFYAGGKLKRSEIVGGAPQVVCEVASGRGGTWNRDGVILFAAADGLFRVPATGGDPQRVTQLDAARKESGHGLPQFLPDGKRFLYFIHSADPNKQGIYAGSLANPKERLRLLATENKACYVPPRSNRTGFLLWLREQTLLAQPFDAEMLRLEGDATLLAEDVAAFRSIAAFWTSNAGLLVYRIGSSSDKFKLIWMSRDGKRLGEVGKEDRYRGLRISPDGKRVAMCREDDGGNADIWVFELGREVMTRLTFDPTSEGVPVWSPDGRQIAYNSNRNGIRQIYRIDAGGGGQDEQLTNSPIDKSVIDWSPGDGRYLLYIEFAPKTLQDLWGLPLQGDRKPIAVLRTPFDDGRAQFSPDGKWIAYESNESGRYQVYVRAFPVSSGQWQVSSQGGSRPRWRANGKELFFLGPNLDKVMATGIRVVGAGIQSDNPSELFSISPVPWNAGSPYEVSADGQRFLVMQPSAVQQGPAPLTVVTNWQAGLKK